MTPEELPAIRTPVSVDELARAFCTAYRALTGETPQRESIILLLAHSALETGRWKSMWCFNIGNVKSRDGDGRCWTFFRCNEIINGKVVWFDPPSPVCRFRAFHTLAEGAVDHIGFLCKSQRYAKAWAEVVAGNPSQFVRELKAAGYFTADLWPYEHSVANIFGQLSAQLTFEVPPDDPPVDDETTARTMALVALTIRGETEDFRRGSALPEDAIVGDEEVPPTPRNV